MTNVILEGVGNKDRQEAGMQKAKVAVVRKLAVILHRMWSDGSDFQCLLVCGHGGFQSAETLRHTSQLRASPRLPLCRADQNTMRRVKS